MPSIQQRPVLAIMITLFQCFSSWSGSLAHAVCDDACAERLFAQIRTLNEKVDATIPIGTILPFAGVGALPPGYLACKGIALVRTDYPQLFAIIGLSFTPVNEQEGLTFRLPNMNGATMIGAMRPGEDVTQPTLEYPLGTRHGNNSTTLNIANLPGHQHNGTTNDNDSDHTHAGQTYGGEAIGYRVVAGCFGAFGTGFNHQAGFGGQCGGLEDRHDTEWSNSQHVHRFSSGGQSGNHKHSFSTDDGSSYGLRGHSFSIMQASVATRFMMKVR